MTINPSHVVTLVDDPGAGTTYVGKAAPGSATSSSVWQIKKIVVAGTVTTITSTGTKAKWTNRSSETYN